MPRSHPEVSVVIPTRNRGDSVIATIESVLACDYAVFEVIVVDQSTNRDTYRATERFSGDSRFRYLETATVGAGQARQIGLCEAKGEIVLYTDDDCTVPANWISIMAGIFNERPQVAVAFCNVVAAPHDTGAGFIPAYVNSHDKLVRTTWDKCRARGMGAGMAVRREVSIAIGGFDAHLGPGALFPACEEGDIAVRALLNGWQLYETAEIAIVHNGFRTWSEGRQLAERNWIGVGAAYAKPFKCKHWQVMPILAYESLIVNLWQPFSQIFRFKRPQGFKSFIYFWKGFLQGLKTPVDCRQMFYNLDSSVKLLEENLKAVENAVLEVRYEKQTT